MIRIDYPKQVLYFLIFAVTQVFFMYKFILFDVAFAFYYVGFVLFFPYGVSRSITMFIAFLTGLTIDIFSNTPGIHAAACVFVAFTKDFWIDIVIRRSDDDIQIDWNELGLWGLIKYMLPLVFSHHLIIFTIENGGLSGPGLLFNKIFSSTIYSFTIIIALSLLLAPKAKRT